MSSLCRVGGFTPAFTPDPPTDPGVGEAEARREWLEAHARCCDCVWYSDVLGTPDHMGTGYWRLRGLCLLNEAPRLVWQDDSGCDEWEER